jgi:hypothetical protein
MQVSCCKVASESGSLEKKEGQGRVATDTSQGNLKNRATRTNAQQIGSVYYVFRCLFAMRLASKHWKKWNRRIGEYSLSVRVVVVFCVST